MGGATYGLFLKFGEILDSDECIHSKFPALYQVSNYEPRVKHNIMIMLHYSIISFKSVLGINLLHVSDGFNRNDLLEIKIKVKQSSIPSMCNNGNVKKPNM